MATVGKTNPLDSVLGGIGAVGSILGPVGSVVGIATDLLGGFIDDGPKFGTQMVRTYESGRSPIDGANLVQASGGNAEKAESLRLQQGWTGGRRSADATFRDCGSFSLWLAVAYGLGGAGFTELPSRCADKQHKVALDSLFGGGGWRDELQQIYSLLSASDDRALPVIGRLQSTLGKDVVDVASLRQYVGGIGAVMPGYDATPTRDPAPSREQGPGRLPPPPVSPSVPAAQPAALPAAAILIGLALLLSISR